MRAKVSHLKELMVREGFVEVRIKMTPRSASSMTAAGADNMTSVQDCLEDLKRSITEVVECWNIQLSQWVGLVGVVNEDHALFLY